ncbi:geobacillin-26 family protein [uncultured Psychrobacillus sp.]|mgnify:CR=1 FL=1|uniref:geobacillin-26 family protein n=1 Tax=uncultured Psychrobacillus sp. TaxID=1551585 RepID=UPI00262FEBF2|nr:geobacillin-26 family protein [uncultured Psychrobacillus sp.]
MKNIRTLKVVVAVMIFFSIFASPISTALAAENTVLQLENGESYKVNDSKNERVVESINGNVYTKVTFDKLSNVMTIEEEGKEPLVLDLSTSGNEQYQTNNQQIAAATTYQHTLLNYEYEVDQNKSPNVWELRRPKDNIVNYWYKTVKQTSSNKADLIAFRNAVEDLNAAEIHLLATITIGIPVMTVLAAVFSIVTAGTGAAPAAILMALGLTGSALKASLNMVTAASDAHFYYFEV